MNNQKFVAGWRYAAFACDDPALSMALRYRSSKDFLFVALVLVLLAQAQNLPEDFHIETLSLGLCEDLLLALVQRLDLVVDVLNSLDERANAIARDSCRFRHGCSSFQEVVR